MEAVTVGRRALVAYARDEPEDDRRPRYDIYDANCGGDDLTLAARLRDPARDPVSTEPVADGVSFAAVVDRVDLPVHEAVYLVEGEAVSVYRGLWLAPARVDGGLLAAVDWRDPRDDARLRAWFRGARAVAAACRERGLLRDAGGETVAALIAAELRDWSGDREVLRCPG